MKTKKKTETIVSKGMTLVHAETGKPVSIGEKVISFRGEPCTILGGTAPVHSGSTGRVYVQSGTGFKSELFPGVFDMKWREA